VHVADAFLKDRIIFLNGAESIPNPVNGEHVERPEKPIQGFWVESFCTRQKVDERPHSSNYMQGIHERILVVGNKQDGLIFGDLFPARDPDPPVKKIQSGFNNGKPEHLIPKMIFTHY
tara:strand:- start:103544 stop:103897 length:354 start_codon:yes stop_codon:yes gene_type:complete